jgi:hypothetical protein
MLNVAPPAVASRFGSALIKERSIEIFDDKDNNVRIVNSSLGSLLAHERLRDEITAALKKPETLRSFLTGFVRKYSKIEDSPPTLHYVKTGIPAKLLEGLDSNADRYATTGQKKDGTLFYAKLSLDA